MGFRIAIGSGKCSDYERTQDPVVQAVCRELRKRLDDLRSLGPDQLRALPTEKHETCVVGSKEVRFSTYRDPTESGEEIVVVQAFLPSLRHARYFAAIGIGLMLAEGLVLQSNRVQAAPDDLLWSYR